MHFWWPLSSVDKILSDFSVCFLTHLSASCDHWPCWPKLLRLTVFVLNNKILPSDFAAFASSNYSAKDSFSWGFDDSNNKLAPHRARPQVAATNLASVANYRGKKLTEPGSVFLDLFEITSTSMLPISCSANNVMLCPLVWYQCLNLVILEKFSYMWL